jgi:hypothetical protein
MVHIQHLFRYKNVHMLLHGIWIYYEMYLTWIIHCTTKFVDRISNPHLLISRLQLVSQSHPNIGIRYIFSLPPKHTHMSSIIKKTWDLIVAPVHIQHLFRYKNVHMLLHGIWIYYEMYLTFDTIVILERQVLQLPK